MRSSYTLLKSIIGVSALIPAIAFSATWNVSSVSALRNAMANVNNGDTIIIASGTYQPGSNLSTTTIGDRSNGNCGNWQRSLAPQFMLLNKTNITIRGASSSNRPILKGTDQYDGKYVLYAQKADGLVLKDLDIRNSEKGVVIDRSDNVVVDNLNIQWTGHEALHFRDGSDNAEVKNSTIKLTGLARNNRGEGLYICNDKKKWHTNYCEANDDFFQEKCDNFHVHNNTFGPNIGAEHIDIKEGTRGHNIHDNTFIAAINHNLLLTQTDNRSKSIIHDKGYNNRIHNNDFNLQNMKWDTSLDNAGALRVEQVLDDTEYGGNIYGHAGRYVYNEVTNANQTSVDEYVMYNPGEGGNGSYVGCDKINWNQGPIRYFLGSSSKSGFNMVDLDSNTDGIQANGGPSVSWNNACNNHLP